MILLMKVNKMLIKLKRVKKKLTMNLKMQILTVQIEFLIKLLILIVILESLRQFKSSMIFGTIQQLADATVKY